MCDTKTAAPQHTVHRLKYSSVTIFQEQVNTKSLHSFSQICREYADVLQFYFYLTPINKSEYLISADQSDHALVTIKQSPSCHKLFEMLIIKMFCRRDDWSSAAAARWILHYIDLICQSGANLEKIA